jgi:hypothetical protein
MSSTEIRLFPERNPALGLLLVLGLVGCAVLLLDRFSATRPTVTVEGVRPADPLDRPGPVPIPAPRTAAVCQIMLILVMSYAILGNLV